MTGGDMNVAPLFVWVAGISTLLSLGITIWNLVTSGARVNSKRITDHAKKIDLLQRQIDQFEDRIQRAPSIDMMHRLELSMTRIDGELGQLNERLKPVASIVDRMQELMLQQSGKI